MQQIVLNLIDGIGQNRQYPKTFEIPDDEEIARLRAPGSFVKLGFIGDGKHQMTERMWVILTKMDLEKDEFEGILDNDPATLTNVKWGDEVKFQRRHILSTHNREEAA